MGVSVIQNIKQQGLEIDLDVAMQGMKDALGNRKLLLTEEELRATLTAVQTDIRLKQRQARRFAEVDRLFIPSELSYQRGSGSAIGPNETLIFEIELLSIR